VACSLVGNVAIVALFLMFSYGIINNSVTAVAAIFGSGLVVGAVVKTFAYSFTVRKMDGI
jgi:multisubunit Na+/H+ antiporter MnhE subunit